MHIKIQKAMDGRVTFITKNLVKLQQKKAFGDKF